MAKELKIKFATGKTIYANVINAARQIWSVAGTAFITTSTAAATNCNIALTEQGSTGWYFADFPTGIVTSGRYTSDAFLQAGGSAAFTDTLIGSGFLDWTGTVENVPPTIPASSTNITNASGVTVSAGTVAVATSVTNPVTANTTVNGGAVIATTGSTIAANVVQIKGVGSNVSTFLGTSQPINLSGTGASALVKSNLYALVDDFAGAIALDSLIYNLQSMVEQYYSGIPFNASQASFGSIQSATSNTVTVDYATIPTDASAYVDKYCLVASAVYQYAPQILQIASVAAGSATQTFTLKSNFSTIPSGGDSFGVLAEPPQTSSGGGGAAASDVWQFLLTGATAPNTFGGLVQGLGAEGGLTGPSGVTLTFHDGNGSPVAGVPFTLLASGVPQGSSAANASGVGTFSFANGIYIVAASITNGVVFANTSLSISGTTTLTITGTTPTIPSPPSGNQVTAYGYTYANGALEPDARVFYQLVSSPLAGTIQDHSTQSAYSNGSGLWSFTADKGAIYRIWRNETFVQTITIPADASSPYELQPI